MFYKTITRLSENQEIYKDKNQRRINVGDKVAYRKRKGIIKEEDREGQYIELEDGFKLRLSEYHKKIHVLKGDKKR